ncbi:MAG: hypothetical protein ACOY46_18500 [Bacillota bacterium]
MGLTIHYQLGYGGHSPEEVLEKLRQKALDMPVEEVSPQVLHFAGKMANHQSHQGKDEHTWALIQATEYVQVGNVSIGVPPKEVYFFSVWPGEECEEANFGLAKYPATITYRGRKIPTGLGGAWRWRSFCKTQYASNVSTEHFLKCHASVCSLLKEAERIGILKKVNDEGHFWDHWDYEALVREVAEWNSMIGDFIQKLESVFGGENVVSSLKGKKSTR